MQLEILSSHPGAGAKRHPLLFVHGMWHGAWCYAEHFMPFFTERGYRSYALSLRGHGGSERPGDWPSPPLKDYVADLAEAAARLDEKPILVGHSMGGLVVQKYLEAHTAAAAVLLASLPPAGILGASLRTFRLAPLRVLRSVLTADLSPLIGDRRLSRRLFFSAELPEETLNSYCSRLSTESFRAYLDLLFPKVRRAGAPACPVLVLGAAEDAFISRAQVDATARHYGADKIMLPNVAHDIMLDPRWEQGAAAIAAWLSARGL